MPANYNEDGILICMIILWQVLMAHCHLYLYLLIGRSQFAVCVVLASKGYPEAYSKR